MGAGAYCSFRDLISTFLLYYDTGQSPRYGRYFVFRSSAIRTSFLKLRLCLRWLLDSDSEVASLLG